MNQNEVCIDVMGQKVKETQLNVPLRKVLRKRGLCSTSAHEDQFDWDSGWIDIEPVPIYKYSFF